MKKVIGILCCVITATSSLFSFTYSNKTYLQLRPTLHNLPLRDSLWHQHVTNDIGNSFGMTIQATALYHQTNNRNDLGEYFGVNKCNLIRVRPDDENFDQNVDFPSTSILHNSVSPTSFSMDIEVRPEHQRTGLMLSLFQDLEKIASGLSIRFYLPLLHVRNNVDLGYCSRSADDVCLAQRYFLGKQTDEPKQQPLKCGKLNCRQSTTQFADFAGFLTYNFLEVQDYLIGMDFGFIVPTGSTPNSEFLFEPVVGNGGNAGLSIGAHATATLWRNEMQTSSFEIVCHVVWSYLFNNHQKRIIGLLSQDLSKIAWGHYRLGAEIGKAGVFPLANVLCSDVNVDQGSQVEAMLAAAINVSRFNLTFGADLYDREGETIRRIERGNSLENRYGLVSESYDPCIEFDPGLDLYPTERIITCETLDVTSAQTPAQTTAQFFLTLGYAESDRRYPVFFGIGGSYEIGCNNNISEGPHLWASFGLSF